MTCFDADVARPLQRHVKWRFHVKSFNQRHERHRTVHVDFYVHARETGTISMQPPPRLWPLVFSPPKLIHDKYQYTDQCQPSMIFTLTQRPPPETSPPPSEGSHWSTLYKSATLHSLVSQTIFLWAGALFSNFCSHLQNLFSILSFQIFINIYLDVQLWLN